MSLESLQIEGIVPIPKKCPVCDLINMGTQQCRGCGYSLVPPEALEWRAEMMKDAHLLADLFVPVQGEINKTSNANLAGAIIGFCLEVRQATLEEAAEALEKEMPTAWFPEGALQLKRRYLEEAVATIRSLMKE